ncbi:D-2-hydroxyacid dehydrogenase [Motilimonas eburnea]|uniref:D-2-hydroxyacid dehydrogenase n=1 Tax=Motilimonas eburnea TaxID=1737488 RepID=UPI001E45E1F5|nr:D-2-hydroxyacid dehydrogenase [Motilimonas eburnea]MCE2572752.1 D-2-hydroxyacid dehydrogenase [Motilimonas eburnea]
MRHTLLILSQDALQYQQALADKLPADVSMLVSDNIDSVASMQQQITLALAEPALIRPLLPKLPNLQWLQSTFAGVDALAGASLADSCQVTGVKGIFGPLISEYVFGHLLDYQRQFGLYRQQQGQQRWLSHGYHSIQGMTILIVGTGSIGQHVAQTARHFGLTTLGVNRSGQQREDFLQCYPLSQLHTALSQADIVVNSLPLTKETQGLFNASCFKQMPHYSLFFNVGRGASVNEKDLYDALTQRQIAHAFCDVFSVEPLASDSPLWRCPHLTITPHIAAISSPQQVAHIFLDNFLRRQQRQPLLHQIDFTLGY